MFTTDQGTMAVGPVLVCESCSVVSDSLQPHGLYSPWNSPGQNTGVGSLSLLQQIFPTQGSNPGLPRCRHILYQLSYQGSLMLVWLWPYKRQKPGQTHRRRRPGEVEGTDWQRYIYEPKNIKDDQQAPQVAPVLKNLPANAEAIRDVGSNSGSGRSLGGGHDYPHSRILAWRISWTNQPSRLQSMGSQRVGHD